VDGHVDAAADLATRLDLAEVERHEGIGGQPRAR
jgi:hypothetical protein